jgi:tetratricopeptide (TPR) repeat protein
MARPSVGIHRVLSLSLLLIVLSTALLLSAVSSVFAQADSTKGADSIKLAGKVRNSKGEGVGGASVSLEEKGQANSEQTKTDAEGKFGFVLARPGVYTVTAEKAGIRSRSSEPVELSAGQMKSMELILDISATSAAPGEMEFADKPNFTVAGVTDWSGAGGHGSDSSLRTSESLARDTLALKPSGADTASANGRAKEADTHRLKGENDERSGDALGAVREFELAASLDPTEQNYFAWGTELLLHRAVTPAAIVFKQGSAAHPNSARMLAGLGAALYSAGSYDEAASALCRASDLEPGDAAPYIFIGKMEASAATTLGCAGVKLARFLQLQPENSLANYYYAMVLLKPGREAKSGADLQHAQSLLEKAVAIDPKLGEGYLQLGILYAARGETKRATDFYEKAIVVNPHLLEAHYRLGQLYKRIGKKAEADREIQLYREGEKQEADAVERQRREVQQFLIILKEPGSSQK